MHRFRVIGAAGALVGLVVIAVAVRERSRSSDAFAEPAAPSQVATSAATRQDTSGRLVAPTIAAPTASGRDDRRPRLALSPEPDDRGRDDDQSSAAGVPSMIVPRGSADVEQ